MPKRTYTRQTPQVKLAKVNARIMKMEATIEKKQRRVADLHAISQAYQVQIAERATEAQQS